MPVTIGRLSIKPWGVVEQVAVRADMNQPDNYRIVVNNKDLFTVHALDQAELVDKATKKWRAMFPDAR